MHNLKYNSEYPCPGEKDTLNESNTFQPSIPVEDIFEQMFALEIRDGSLTPKRRKRLVQYAAQMGLSARQAGVLLERSCQKTINEGVEPAYGHALHIAHPPEPRISEPVRIALIVAISLVVDALLIYWLW